MTNNDKKIFMLKEKLESKKNALGKKPDIKFKTNCMFTLFGITYNLHTMNELELTVILNWISNLNGNMTMGANFTAKDYVSDIKGKLTLLDYNKCLGDIMSMEKQLDALISSETKTTIEIEKLEKLIG